MATSEPTVLYVGNFNFPTNGAAAKRVLNVGRGLRAAGFHVIYAGNNDNPGLGDAGGDGLYQYDGFEYVVRARLSSARRRLDSYNSYPRLRRVIEARRAAGYSIVAVIGYHMDAMGMALCMRYCRAHGTAFIADCTEWYDPVQTVHGRLGMAYLSSQVRMLILNKRADGVIAISRFLEQYYARFTRVLRVPPLDDVTKHERRASEEGAPVRFAYCGTPGKKDDVDVIYQAFRLVGGSVAWELNLVGLEESDYELSLTGYPRETRDRFIFHGRVPAHTAQWIVAHCDYSVLMRPAAKRYAQAGFPTKVTESMSVGTPVIANESSDLGEYIRDGDTGILVGGSTADDLAVALWRALSIPKTEAYLMGLRALSCARSSFDYRAFSPALGAFVVDCIGHDSRL